MNIPKTFKRSKRAPSKEELEWLYNWLHENKEKYNLNKVLEFGCGITSWILNNAIKPEIHVAMEIYKPCIKTTLEHVPDIKIIQTIWDDIPKISYDVIFIDGSSGCPPKIAAKGKGIYRKEALKYSKEIMAKNALIIIHDWRHKKIGWLRLRNYLDENYEFIDGCKIGYGFGIYKVNK